MEDCSNNGLPMKGRVGRVSGFAMFLVLFALGQQPAAFAQAGSTGGTIGKQEKSISSGEEPRAPVPARSRSRSQNSAATGQSQQNVSGKGCGRIVGTWKWSNGVDVVIKPDSTADGTDGGRGVLTCDSGMYVFKWQAAGNMSRMTLAADGRRLSGMGSFGPESAVRK
jgi:hypothetical protein